MKLVLFSALFLFFEACGPSAKPAVAKHYAMSGKIVSVNTKDQTASIDAAAMPGYMEAMRMEYPIQSKEEFEGLHVGDRITATLDVDTDGGYTVTKIKHLPSTEPSPKQ